jgi:acyl carrier protein
MSHDTLIDGDAIPVGYAQKDKELLLLDRQGNQVVVDEIGEIVVKSSYLSPGYWRRPDLTEAKFKPDPSDPSKRLYHTGDLAQRLPDGCLVHQGRKDARIKIRGYRVDILEVESVLRGHPKAKEVVVVIHENKQGDDSLTAYFVPSENGPTSPGELRAFLKIRFPDYMIPSRFVALTRLPLTPNGKIDRQALPEAGNSRPELATSYSAPETSVERELTQIWADVLLLDQVGIHDNFFDLGGHSLAASRVISRVIQTFKLDLPLKALFDAPTVAEMAMVILEHQANQASQQILDHMLREVEAMSEKEAQRLLEEEKGSRKTDRT